MESCETNDGHLMMGTSKSCKTSIKGLASGDKFVSNTKEIVCLYIDKAGPKCC